MTNARDAFPPMWKVVPEGRHGNVAVECAHAVVDGEHISAAVDRGATQIKVRHWIVEPAPGLLALYSRWRYRLVGQYVESFVALRKDIARQAEAPPPPALPPGSEHETAAVAFEQLHRQSRYCCILLLDRVLLQPRFFVAVFVVGVIVSWLSGR